MTITALMDPSEYPTPSDDQIIFDNKMSAYFRNLALRGQQENDIAANLNTIAAGGAYAIPYVYAGPAGSGGKLTFSGGTMDTSNFLTLDNISAGGLTVAARVASFGASTSAVKGTLRLEKQGDPTKFLVFNVTGVTASTGYQSVYVTKVESSSSSPFNLNDALIVQFTRAGDKGDTGAAVSPTLRVQDVKTSGLGGGASVLGVQTRTLNTLMRNNISGASLASNQVTLPAGTYKVTGSVPGIGTQHQAYLYSVSGTGAGTSILAGSVSQSASGTTSTDSRSILEGEIVITATTVIELRHYFAAANATNGLGSNLSSGVPAVFSMLTLEKIA